MSDVHADEVTRQDLLDAARERLQEHLDREAVALAREDAEGVLAQVEQLTAQLRPERPA